MAPSLPSKFEHLWQLPFEGAWPMAVAFVGDGRVAAGNRDGQIYVWELPEQPSKDSPPVPTRRLDGHDNGITRLLPLPDGRHLVSASLDRTVRIWDLEAPPSGQAEVVLDAETRKKAAKRDQNDAEAPGVPVELQTQASILEGHGNWIQALGISRDGRRLISGDDDCLTIVWDLEQRQPVTRWQGHPGNWVVSAALSPDGKAAFTAEYAFKRGDFDRPPAQARFWDLESGEVLVDLLVVQFPNVKVRDSSYGYASTWGKFVGAGFVAADISFDGKLLAIGQGGEIGSGKVHLVEVATGKVARTVADHRYGVCDAKFSADGQHVLSVGRDTTLQICQVADGKEIARLHEPRGGQFKDWLSAVALSPNHQWLAAADIAGIVHLWRGE